MKVRGVYGPSLLISGGVRLLLFWGNFLGTRPPRGQGVTYLNHLDH